MNDDEFEMLCDEACGEVDLLSRDFEAAELRDFYEALRDHCAREMTNARVALGERTDGK